MKDRIGQQLGKYLLIHLLGSGAFADVYLGEHTFLQTKAAIKVLHTKLVAEEGTKFLEEARIIAGLSHPNIVEILDSGLEDISKTEEVVPYLVMKYARYGSILKRYPRGSVLSPQQIIPYAKQLASALDYAHGQGLIHLDVKPENILLGENDILLLSDFGIAVTFLQIANQSGKIPVIGTLPYMAPEQIIGRPHPASDQYALAIIIYEWLCGEYPFRGSADEIIEQHLHTTPKLLHSMINIPEEFEKVVMRGLEKDPKSRFASMMDFALALERAYQEDSRSPLILYNHTKNQSRPNEETIANHPLSMLPETSRHYNRIKWNPRKSEPQWNFDILFSSGNRLFHWLGLILIILSSIVLNNSPLLWGDMWVWSSVGALCAFFVYVAALQMTLILPMGLLLSIYWGYTISELILIIQYSFFNRIIFNSGVIWYVSSSLCFILLIWYRYKSEKKQSQEASAQKSNQSKSSQTPKKLILHEISQIEAIDPSESSPSEASLTSPDLATAESQIEAIDPSESSPSEASLTSEKSEQQVLLGLQFGGSQPSTRIFTDTVEKDDNKDDFYISYNKNPSDFRWAMFINLLLKGYGYSVTLPPTDFRGSDFMRHLQKAARKATRTIIILSPDYLNLLKSQPAWIKILQRRTKGNIPSLIPICTHGCGNEFSDLLNSISYINIIGDSEATAGSIILAAIKGESIKLNETLQSSQEALRLLPDSFEWLTYQSHVLAQLKDDAKIHQSIPSYSNQPSIQPTSITKHFEIFFSYSHKDEKLRDQLEKHLSALKRQGLYSWYDREIRPGEVWDKEIDTHLNTASIILLLISPDFMHSEYCYINEMKRALERHAVGAARVIPIILRPTDLVGTPLERLQALPKGAKAVTSWLKREEALLDIVKGIRRAFNELNLDI